MSNDWFEQRKRLCSTIFHYASHWIWYAQLVDILQLEISNPFAFTHNANRTLYQNSFYTLHMLQRNKFESHVVISFGLLAFSRQVMISLFVDNVCWSMNFWNYSNYIHFVSVYSFWMYIAMYKNWFIKGKWVYFLLQKPFSILRG